MLVKSNNVGMVTVLFQNTNFELGSLSLCSRVEFVVRLHFDGYIDVVVNLRTE